MQDLCQKNNKLHCLCVKIIKILEYILSELIINSHLRTAQYQLQGHAVMNGITKLDNLL